MPSSKEFVTEWVSIDFTLHSNHNHMTSTTYAIYLAATLIVSSYSLPLPGAMFLVYLVSSLSNLSPVPCCQIPTCILLILIFFLLSVSPNLSHIHIRQWDMLPCKTLSFGMEKATP